MIWVAVFKELQIGNIQDPNKLMKKLYLFGEELRQTFRNLDEDNMSSAYLDHISERNEKTRTIKFDADGLQISFENTQNKTKTSLEQDTKKVELLVTRGTVVETMLSRMELYGESIHLTTGHVTFDAENFKLDIDGNAEFTGSITGGTMKIGTGFAVDSEGNVVIEGDLNVSLLNPTDGVVVGGDVEVEGDEGYGYCTIGGELSGEDAFVYGKLSCSRVKYSSDERLKIGVIDISPVTAEDLLRQMEPVEFVYKASGIRSMGFIAQNMYLGQETAGVNLPLVKRQGRYLKLPYDSYGALYAAVIQENQRRIDAVRQQLEKRKVG